MTLERATDVFVEAFSAGRSVVHPYRFVRHGSIWVMRDDPPRRRPRKSEVVVAGATPSEVVAVIEASDLGWHFIADIRPAESDSKEGDQAYADLGYRRLATEWVFSHDLHDIPEFECAPPVRLISTAEAFAAIPQRVSQPRRWRVDARQYAAWDGERDYGWVMSRPTGADSWVEDLFVHAEVRRRGFGRALMSRLLRDDREAGIEHSVLVASTAGSHLYPQLGYRQLGVLRIYCPRDRA